MAQTDKQPDDEPKRRSGLTTGALVISDGLRDIEARRDVGVDPPIDGTIAIGFNAVTGEEIHGTLVPWKLPRPPDAPPPRAAIGPTPNHDRRAYVEQLWRAMYSRGEIVTIVCKRFPGTNERTIDKDLARVKKIYLETARDPDVVELAREQMVGMLVDLQREARASGDRSTARFALDKIAKIRGLYAPIKIETTETHVHTVALSLEEMVGALDEEGRKALELVLAQVERAGIKPPELPAAGNRLRLPGGRVIDASSDEVDDDDDCGED